MAVERYNKNVLPDTGAAPEKKVKTGAETKTKSHVVGLKRSETLIYLFLFILIATVSIYVLSLKMEAYDLQTQITQVESDISTKEGEISELNTEVTDLASYDRIYEKANELGLDQNNANVKVAEKYGEN